MVGKRNLTIGIVTLLCQAFVSGAGIHNGTDPVGLATVLGAIGGTAIGVIYGRGYNKKVAPEQ